jgi:hypothetical protein
MTSYNNFDSEIYSEDCAQVSESEYDEVMQLMAEDHEAFAGYGDWSTEIEKDYLGGYSNNSDGPSYNGIAI